MKEERPPGAGRRSSYAAHPFAFEILDSMRRQGISLRELCRLSGLDPSFFSKVLGGKRNPPSDEGALRRLARALSLDARWLIVCAGRIPAEWESLSRDKLVFGRVANVVAGNRPARLPPPRLQAALMRLPARPASSGLKASGLPAPQRSRVGSSLSEELL